MFLPVIITVSITAFASILNAFLKGRYSDRVFKLFLATWTFTLLLVLVAEFCLSNIYALATFLCIFNPDLRSMVDESPLNGSKMLHELQLDKLVMERNTRVVASVLALCALTLVWYRVFLVVSDQLGAWRSIGRNQKHDALTPDPQDTDDERITSLTSRLLVCVLLLIVILNDGLYNREIRTAFVFTSSPTSGVLFSAFTRFISMASQALVICMVEIAFLASVFYVIPTLSASRNHESKNAPGEKKGDTWFMHMDHKPEKRPGWYCHGQVKSGRQRKDLEYGF